MRLRSILFTLCLTVLAACGPMARTARQEAAATAQEASAAADWVWTYSQAHPDGFTVDIRDRKVPTEGISVAYAATQDRHSKEDLGDVVSHALAHDGYVGGWWNSEDSLYYFDSVRILPESAAGEAVSFALENEQLAFYVLSTGEEVRIDNVIHPHEHEPTDLRAAGPPSSWPAPSTMATARTGSRRSPRSSPGGIGGTCSTTPARKNGTPSARARWTIRSIGNSSTWKRPTTS